MWDGGAMLVIVSCICEAAADRDKLQACSWNMDSQRMELRVYAMECRCNTLI